jgi:hypothetical protein
MPDEALGFELGQHRPHRGVLARPRRRRAFGPSIARSSRPRTRASTTTWWNCWTFGSRHDERIAVAAHSQIGIGAPIEQVTDRCEGARAGGRDERAAVAFDDRVHIGTRVWVETLWEQGTRRVTGEWRTPLSMARRGQHEAVVRVLISAGARE